MKGFWGHLAFQSASAFLEHQSAKTMALMGKRSLTEANGLTVRPWAPFLSFQSLERQSLEILSAAVFSVVLLSFSFVLWFDADNGIPLDGSWIPSWGSRHLSNVRKKNENHVPCQHHYRLRFGKVNPRPITNHNLPKLRRERKDIGEKLRAESVGFMSLGIFSFLHRPSYPLGKREEKNKELYYRRW